jgi:hypothetical protein
MVRKIPKAIAIDTEKWACMKSYEPTFWRNVDVKEQNECWLWLISTASEGRAKVTVGSRHKKYTMASARYIYMITNNILLTSNQCVCHSCDNVLCVNPKHLWLGSKTDNNRDRAQKGRSVSLTGESNGNSKLEKKDAIRIKYGKESPKLLADLFNIHPSTVWLIRKGKLWPHV